MGTLSFRQPIADKLTDISEYLNQWFGALPTEAIQLKSEWNTYSLQEQAEIHDTYYDEYYEFTKHIELLNGEVYL
jgi:hypothetical protein